VHFLETKNVYFTNKLMMIVAMFCSSVCELYQCIQTSRLMYVSDFWVRSLFIILIYYVI